MHEHDTARIVTVKRSYIAYSENGFSKGQGKDEVREWKEEDRKGCCNDT